MATPSRPSAAGGVLIALGALGGTIIGLILGAVTPGFLVGTGTGIALSVLIWLRDR